MKVKDDYTTSLLARERREEKSNNQTGTSEPIIRVSQLVSFNLLKSANIHSNPFISGCLLNNSPKIDYVEILPKYDLT
jgi:hypothetical protein